MRTIAVVGASLAGLTTTRALRDHPGARALADRFGFSAARTLLQLERPLTDADDSPLPPWPTG